MPKLQRCALTFQAVYYVATGLWPLLSRRTFEAVTGRKQDWWLVQMVGLLAFTNGVALAAGLRSGGTALQMRTLSVLSALSFFTIDTVYAMKGRISKIYLADAVVEATLVALVEWPQHDEYDGSQRDGERRIL